MKIQEHSIPNKERVGKIFKHGNSLKTSPLLYPKLCHMLFEKCSASGSIRQPVAEKRPSYQLSGGAIGALDGTLIHASVLSHKQNVYRARGRGDSYRNVLAICDFNMIFIYIVARWRLGTGPRHENTHTRGFMAPYRNVSTFSNIKEYAQIPLVKQRDITIACFAIHNFIRKEGLSDDFFAQYDQSDIHINENVRDDNDGDVEVAEPIGSEADQQYMINLRDDSALQIMQARSFLGIKFWSEMGRHSPSDSPLSTTSRPHLPSSPPLYAVVSTFVLHHLHLNPSSSPSLRELLVPLMELLYMLLFRLINRIYTEQEEEAINVGYGSQYRNVRLTNQKLSLPCSVSFCPSISIRYPFLLPGMWCPVLPRCISYGDELWVCIVAGSLQFHIIRQQHRLTVVIAVPWPPYYSDFKGLLAYTVETDRHTRGFMAPYRNARYWLGDFFRKRTMTSKEKFNHAHAKHRNVIERAFGVLKARFPILKNGDETISLAPVVSANEELMKLKQGVASLLEVPKGKNINELADDAR
ncbi:hypothetical protein Tco_0256467 [Tanacetum coccineum]